MTRTVCTRCGVGSVPGVPSELARITDLKNGFRTGVFYVHRHQGVCEAVERFRAARQAEQEKTFRRYNRPHLRFARWAGRQTARIVGRASKLGL